MKVVFRYQMREDVSRKETILIEYYDENFVKHTETFSDIRARVIQHESMTI